MLGLGRGERVFGCGGGDVCFVDGKGRWLVMVGG